MNKEKISSLWRENKILILILAGSFLLCLAYAFYFRIEPAVDARAYDKIAQNIALGAGYREEPQKDIRQDFAIARVGPLYEYFLAGFYKTFGHHYGPVWAGQAALHALSAWLIYLTCLLIFADNARRRRIALWAAAFFGFYPDLIEISAMLMTETLYLFFVCLLFYLFFRYLAGGGYRLASLLGLAAGLATLSRPPVLFLIPVILFYFWRRKLWRPALLFLTALFFVFIPWTARNYFVYDQIMPFGAAGNYNFWIGNWHGGDGEQSPQPFHTAFTAAHQIEEINGESMRQFKLFLREHPAEFLKLTALRAGKYFSLTRPMGWWFYQKGIGQMLFVSASFLASVPLFIFGLAGLIKSLKSANIKQRYLAAFAVATPLIVFITVVETRYRFQIYPLLAIFACYFFVETRRFWRDKIFLVSAAILFLNAAIDIFSNIGRIMEKINKLL